MMEKESIFVHSTVLLAGLSFSTVPIFSAILRDSNVSSMEQSFIRLFIGSLAGIIFVIIYRNTRNSIFQKSIILNVQKTYIVQGMLLALSLNCYLASIALGTPVGEAALLCQTHPIVTFILASIILKEIITGKKIISLLFAISGIILLTQPWQWSSFLHSFIGVFLAALSGISYGVYIIIGRFSVSTRKTIPSALSIGWVLIWGFFMWLPLFFIIQMIPLSPIIISFDFLTFFIFENFLFGLLLGTIGNIIPFGLIMLTSSRIESTKASILLLIEPLGAIVLGNIILNESITIWYILGGLLLLVAIVIISLETSSKMRMDLLIQEDENIVKQNLGNIVK